MPEPANSGGWARWRDLTRILTARNLKIRYKGSALGFFWSLLTPATTIAMYAIFAGILKFAKGQNYLPFLVTGLLVWGFTAGTLNDSLFAIAGNANLVKKVWFPRVNLPLTTALANAVNFALTLAPLLLYLALDGVLDLSHALWLLPAAFFHLALCVGIACLVSTLNVFFRDTQHIVGVGQLAWFFLTPVFYRPAMQVEAAAHVFPGGWAGLAYLNPMTGVLAMYRRGLMGGDPQLVIVPPGISPWWIAASCAMCLATLVIGLVALRRGDRSFGDAL